MFEELYAIPVLKGKKTESEKFAGADYTTSVETFLPSGKAIQCATSHMLGQNFAKAFNISFLDKNEQKQFAWQNSWGVSTRSIGIMIMMHSDNSGLVLPPRVAHNKAVIVPITNKDNKEQILERATELKEFLPEYEVILDDRDGYTPGWKYNEWEMKGIPVRIEFGPKDMEKHQVVLVRRDTKEKEFVMIKDLRMRLPKLLEEIQLNLFTKAKRFLESSIVSATNLGKIKEALEDKKLVLTNLCDSEDCEASLKELGAKTINMPFDQHPKGDCAICGGASKMSVYVGKSY